MLYNCTVNIILLNVLSWCCLLWFLWTQLPLELSQSMLPTLIPRPRRRLDKCRQLSSWFRRRLCRRQMPSVSLAMPTSQLRRRRSSFVVIRLSRHRQLLERLQLRRLLRLLAGYRHWFQVLSPTWCIFELLGSWWYHAVECGIVDVWWNCFLSRHCRCCWSTQFCASYLLRARLDPVCKLLSVTGIS